MMGKIQVHVYRHCIRWVNGMSIFDRESAQLMCRAGFHLHTTVGEEWHQENTVQQAEWPNYLAEGLARQWMSSIGRHPGKV
eukprot:1144417-Pelagomonas_calceolata.AAC.5